MKHAPVIAGFALCLAVLVDPPARAEPSISRVVALGDLHGDLEQALAALRLAGVVDGAGRWSGGTATLVQTGDVTDRGPDSKAVIDLLRRLQTEATASGGTVVALVGNHEAMNVTGDWRYVHSGDVQAFGGVEARAAAFSLQGEYGAWVAGQPIVAKVGANVFVHGGITPAWAEKGIDGMHSAWRASLAGGDDAVLGTDGPLWFRGYAQEPERTACPMLATALEALGARRMIVGHTTRRSGRIEARCGGALLMIDTGISRAYGGHLAALQITDDGASALYPSGPQDLPDPTGE